MNSDGSENKWVDIVHHYRNNLQAYFPDATPAQKTAIYNRLCEAVHKAYDRGVSESRWNTRTVIPEKKLFNSSYADKILQSILPIYTEPAKNARWCQGHRNGGTVTQYLLPCEICDILRTPQGENK